VFLHFKAPRQSCDNIVIHADHEPSEPTTSWRPGELVIDGPRLIRVPKTSAEQDDFIHVSVYDFGGSGKRLLDTYPATRLRVTHSARPSSQLSPPPLSQQEVAARRKARVRRIDPRKRIGVQTAVWRLDIDRWTGAWQVVCNMLQRRGVCAAGPVRGAQSG